METPARITKSIDYKVPAGVYLLSISQIGGNLATITITGTGAECSEVRKTLAGNQMSFYKYVTTGTDDTLNISVDSLADSAIKFVVDPLYRTTYRTYTNDSSVAESDKIPLAMSVDSIITKINKLDTQCDFDYTYAVPSDVRIDNPIDCYSFVDSNHPFNLATICEWDAENEDTNKIDITNKIK
jgi:hypothetical protein